MKHLQITLLAALCISTIQAAETVALPREPHVITVLQGQRMFLDASIAFCQEQVPALKHDLSAARTHAEAELGKAESLILEETAAEIKSYQRYLDTYSAKWSKYASELMVAIKRQNAADACPTLASNWANTGADVLVEDWHNFLQQFGPDSAEVAPQMATGAK